MEVVKNVDVLRIIFKIVSRECTITPVPSGLTYNNEIFQEKNLNATARLWIQENGTVYKQYVIYNELTKKNIDNLLEIASNRALRGLPELSIPLEIYSTDDRVEGYLMEYHDMKSLAYYLSNKNHTVVLMAFRQLASLINKLPRDVYIGDLHAGNVLVNKNEIRIIDIDGFSLKHGHKISCPLESYSNHSIFFHKKYCDRTGNFSISRDSDIACVLWLFLHYLMGTNPFNYAEAELKRYMYFLKDFGLPKDLYEMMMRMMSSKHNYLIPETFTEIPIEMLSQCSYKQFVSKDANVREY